MTSTHSDYKSPDEIEREVEEARAQLRHTLGDIRESLSPGQMLDHAIDYARESGGAEFTRNLGRQVRDNPLPIALIGAGIGWLLASDRNGHAGRLRGRGYRTAAELYTDPNTHHVHVDGPENPDGIGQRMSEKASSAYAGASARTHSASERASGAARSASERASGAARSASERASGMAHTASERASQYAHSASETADSMRHRASETAYSARERLAGAGSAAYGYAADAGSRLRDTGSSLQGSLTRLIDEQPLVLGAIGLAVGAAIGAALPNTRAENRMFGSTADRVKGQASSMAREGLNEAEARARHAARDVRDTLDERGYSPRGASDTLGAVAETVKSDLVGGGRREEESEGKPTPGTATRTGTSGQPSRPA